MAGRKRIYSEILNFDNNEEPANEDDDVKFKNPRKNLFDDFLKTNAAGAAAEEHMKCYLRIRPFTKDELDREENQDPDVMSLLGDDATDMSHIVNTTSSSESSNISCLDKTSKDSLDTDELFSALENRIREETAVNVEDQGQIKFLIWVSFAEIYNEQIFDLLEPLPKKKNARRPVLRLSDDKNGSPYIKGLKEINVTSADEAYKLLTIGQRNLQKACTKLNHCSSRSHCIFNIKILRVVDKGDPHVARVSMLSLCDLAGSERHSKTHSAGERLKEAGNINTSLMTLGRCIETLRYNQNHKDNQRIIPFRDSKLTRLFQNFFSGKGKAVMIVNVNQLASMFDETLHVFKFSAIAKQRPDPPRPKMLSLSALKPPKDPRSSIMWDTPVTKMKSALTSAQAVPLPEGDDNELEDDQSDEIEELVSIIQQLQKQLEEERKEKIMQECKIRDEVCKEMMKQLVEIELECSERIREREIMAEELADQRIKILMEAKKPQEFMQDDDDEWVSSVLYHQEKVKVENKEKEIEELKKEIAQLKAQNKESKLKEFEDIRSKISEEQEKLKTENSKLQDLLSESRKNEELRSKEKKEAEETVRELKDKIKQENTIKELEKALEESRKAVECADERLKKRDERLMSVDSENDSLKEREKNTSMMSELDSSLAVAKATIDDLERQLEMEKEIHAKDLSRISELETEDITIETLKKSLEEIKANYEEVESNLATKVEENLRSDGRIKELETKLLEIQSEKLPDKICGLEKSLMESKSEISCKSSEIEKLKDKVEELVTVNESLRHMVNETTCELQSKEKQIQEVMSPIKVNEVHQTNAESPVSISSLQTLMKKLKAENSQEREQNLRTRLDEASKNMKEMNEKITELEATLLKKNLQIQEMETMNQLNGSQKTPKKEDKFDDSEKLREELREKWKSIQDLQEQNYRLEQKLQSKLQTIKDLRDTMETERKGFDTALADAQANEKLIQELKDGLASQEEIMEAQDLNIQRREEEISMLTKEIETLTDRNKRLLESSGDSGREMREMTKENARLQAEHEVISKQLKEHKENQDNNSECRAEREHMQIEKKKIDEELKTFKTREKNFDEMRKELAKQLERMVPMEKENKALKRELEKLKEEKGHNDEVFKEEETDVPPKKRHFSGHERNRKVSSDKKKQEELFETPVIKTERTCIPETPTNAVSYNLDPSSSNNKENPPQRRPSSRRGRKRRSSSHEVHVASLKKQNTELESTFASDDCNMSQHIEIDATPPIAAKAVRKSRKKRSSVDLLRIMIRCIFLCQDEKSADKSNTGTRRATRGKAAKSVSRISSFVSAIKNSPISRTAKKLLDDITESSPIREVKKSPSDYVEVEDMSTQMSAEKPKEKTRRQTRKKHQLYKEEVQISEPLDCGTFVPSPDDVHQIVQRKLRSRRN
ncbi:hypothetical protein KUTeg_002196 [Tegillarca granosa]|uniref:Kinesin motor domain-containing protein n=1 Tax=Tegillarca granosa TaxID=220873 RepID=A0ABQ9FTN9_TEGGR|nr:hypothetical protein KUTeg_002196 [Tegillarca granosa]